MRGAGGAALDADMVEPATAAAESRANRAQGSLRLVSRIKLVAIEGASLRLSKALSCESKKLREAKKDWQRAFSPGRTHPSSTLCPGAALPEHSYMRFPK
jgi:hypothetical protein